MGAVRRRAQGRAAAGPAGMVAAAVCALALAGCGGGGGGANSGGDAAAATPVGSGVVVSLGTDTVSMATVEGAASAKNGLVQASFSGSNGGLFYARITALDGGADPHVADVQVTSRDTRSATVLVKPRLTLAAGSYRGTLLLHLCPDSACARPFAGSPLRLGYSLVVGPALAVPARQVLTIDSETGTNQLAGRIAVDLGVAASQLGWQASSSVDWLTLEQDPASPGTPLTWRVRPDRVARLPADADAQGAILFSVPNPTGGAGALPIAAATTQVTLRRAVADVDAIGPGTLVAGQPVRVIAQGHGFSGAADVAARLRVTDGNGATVTPTQVTRLSDTALRLDLPALPAGSGQVCLRNALDIAAQCAAWRALAPQVLPATSFATGGGLNGGGSLGGLVHDAPRGWLYLANRGTGAVQRWPDGSGRSTVRVDSPTSLALPGLDDIALSPDGAWLIATQRDGRLHLIDPDTLTSSMSYLGPNTVAVVPSGGHGLAVTNDGRVWLALGAGVNDVYTFDLRTRRFEAQTLDVAGRRFTGGPWFEVSRDGERLLAVQGTGSADSLPMLLKDVSQPGGWRRLPVDPSFFYWSMNGLDDTGSRLQVMGGVWDASGTGRGRLALPEAGWVHAASVLSPDGTRLYVHALPPDWADPAGATPPRVHVFDATFQGGPAAALPLLGGWDLPAWATCRSADPANGGDCQHPQLVVSADGGSLFIAGTARLLVVPVPDRLASIARVGTPGVQRPAAVPGRATASR